MRIFRGLIFLIFGIGLMLMAWRSLKSDWLPFGKGLGGRLELRREEQPLLYWLAFIFYAAAGVALAIFAVRVLAGSAAPLPLR